MICLLKGKRNLSRFLLFIGLSAYGLGIKSTNISAAIAGLGGAILISWVMIDYMSTNK